MGEVISKNESGVVAAGASRVYETSAGLIRATFWSSLSLAKVAPDGWMPVFGRGRDVARSAPVLTEALEKFGLPGGDAVRLAEEILSDWKAVAIPEPRSRRQKIERALHLTVPTLRLLARAPHFVWMVIRDLKRDFEVTEEQPWLVRPSSPEYGVIRLLKTSIGWAEFEFWGGPKARISVYRQDGWLPLGGQRFNVDGSDLTQLLCAQGLPEGEAGQVSNLVLAERQARVAAHA